MLSPLSPDIGERFGSARAASTERDSGMFEEYIDRLSSTSLRSIRDTPAKQSQLGAQSWHGMNSDANGSGSVEAKGLGERILLGLNNTNGQYKKFLSQMKTMEETGYMDAKAMILSHALLLNASTSVEFATRSVIKLATVLDSMLRLQ